MEEQSVPLSKNKGGSSARSERTLGDVEVVLSVWSGADDRSVDVLELYSVQINTVACF